MNNKVYIAIAVAILLLFGLVGVWWLMQSQKSSQPAPKQAVTTAPEASQPKSLKDLLSMGPQQCTFANSTDTSSTEGKLYVASGNVKGDFTSTANGKTAITHMLMVNNTNYIWVEGQKTGFKTAMNPQDLETTSTKSASQTNFDASAKMDYHCDPWSGGATNFSLPVGVTFTNAGAMMAPKSGTTPATPKSIQCAACDQMTDATQKAQCKSYLSCP